MNENPGDACMMACTSFVIERAHSFETKKHTFDAWQKRKAMKENDVILTQ